MKIYRVLTAEQVESIKGKKQTFIDWGRQYEDGLKEQVAALAEQFNLTLSVERIRKLGYAFIVTNEGGK